MDEGRKAERSGEESPDVAEGVHIPDYVMHDFAFARQRADGAEDSLPPAETPQRSILLMHAIGDHAALDPAGFCWAGSDGKTTQPNREQASLDSQPPARLMPRPRHGRKGQRG